MRWPAEESRRIHLLEYAWSYIAPADLFSGHIPNLGVDMVYRIGDPFPAASYSLEGVSYRIVERLLAIFFSEKAVERVVLFLAPADESRPIEGQCRYGGVWFPGDFGCLVVTRWPQSGGQEAVRDFGDNCRPVSSWLEISHEEWEDVRLGRVVLKGVKHWKWGVEEAFVEWYREGLLPSLRDVKGAPLWPRFNGIVLPATVVSAPKGSSSVAAAK